MWLESEGKDRQHSDMPRTINPFEERGRKIVNKIEVRDVVGRLFLCSLFLGMLGYSAWRILQLVCLYYAFLF